MGSKLYSINLLVLVSYFWSKIKIKLNSAYIILVLYQILSDMPYLYKYPRFQVTVDCLVIAKSTLSVLLIKRANNPFKNLWAIPGGFVDPLEPLKDAALRELQEETGVNINEADQFRTYGNPTRDPRGRNITIVYARLLESELEAKGGDDASEAKWFALENLPSLAFDHQQIIKEAAEFYSL